ncbi:MAG TPA: hypothetical protein VMS93_08455, partial [Candidatus Saccharimonadales bacterium]|nr:hypothetical protein [Candidatus Saccharimonadales bacterium]
IQPDEGIVLKFGAKVPGPDIAIRSVNMDFLYGASFDVQVADAYERLILDCMLGDSTLFTRSDEIQAAWRYVTAVRQGWEEAGTPLAHYPAGTWGPAEADALLAADGRAWRRL